MAEVLSFPTKRKAPYRQPADWWKETLPANVEPLYRLSGAPQVGAPVVSPEAALIMAIVEALRTPQKRWRDGPDIYGAIADLAERWRHDPEALLAIRRAAQLMGSRATGRWTP